MTPITEKQKGELAAQTVAKLYENAQLRQEFMRAYSTSPDTIRSFLTTKLDLPPDFANEITSKQDQALSDYIGKLICDFLW